MEQNTNLPQHQTNIPPMMWFLGIGLVIALIAIFVFNVAVSTVAFYGLFAFMIGSHFFMHGGHAGHSGHDNSSDHQHGPMSNAVETDQPEDKKEHSNHGGCC